MTETAKTNEKMVEKPAKVSPLAAVKEEMAPKPAPAAAKAKKAVATMTDGMKALALAKASILKGTGHRPLAPMTTQYPHVSTGSTIVNSLIGGVKLKDGRPMCPGFPRRRITEVYGPESSGKTTLAIQAIVEVQREGGVVAFLDFEHSLHHGYAKQIGVDFSEDKILYYQPDTMEEGFKMMYLCLKAGVDLIVVDSIAAMVPHDELIKKLDDVAKIGAVAKKMSETLPKMVSWLAKLPSDGAGENAKPKAGHPGTALVLINQERAVISTGGGGGAPEPNTSGGKALKYFCYLRLRLNRFKTEKVERTDPITGKKRLLPFGNVTQVKVVKSKIDGKQGYDANIFIRFGFGIDDIYSIIESGAGRGLIKKEGAYYSYGEHRFQGRDKLRTHLLANPKLAAEIQQKVADLIVADAQPISDEELSEEDAMLAELAAEGLGGDDDIGMTLEPEEVVVGADE